MICKELATGAMLDEVLCVCPGCWPIKTCTEGLAYKGPSCGMMAATSSMNLCQKLSSFLFGDTSLKYSSSAFLIELSLVDFVGFRPPYNAMCLVWVLREFLPN